MATKKALKKASFNQFFGPNEQAAHIKGKNYRDLYVEKVNDFFDDRDHNLYIAGQPGVGKTYTVDQIAETHPDVVLLKINGAMKPWAFIKMMASAVYRLQENQFLVPYIDDKNDIFKSNSEYIDMFKIAMGKSTDCIEYNTSLGAQLATAEDFEKEAIEYFKSLNPLRTGFVIPFNKRVKFIFTMNTPLPDKNALDASGPVGSEAWIKCNNRHAIYGRVEYEDLIMDADTYWGWIADVVWNDPTMCEGATPEQRFEMLYWLRSHWSTAVETNLRFVEEKLWKTMKKHPDRAAYTRRWDKYK
jgi:hypothetical protein